MGTILAMTCSHTDFFPGSQQGEHCSPRTQIEALMDLSTLHVKLRLDMNVHRLWMGCSTGLAHRMLYRRCSHGQVLGMICRRALRVLTQVPGPCLERMQSFALTVRTLLLH